MHRTVLRIDWYELRAGCAPSSSDHGARGDQRLLVRERETLAGQQRRHGDGKAGKANDPVDHDVSALGERRERIAPRPDVTVGQLFAECGFVRRISDRDDLWTYPPRLLDELLD